MNCSTRVELNYPRGASMVFLWQADLDGLGFTADVTVWQDEDTKRPNCAGHTVNVRQSSPLGRISVTVDCCGYGAWAFDGLEGADLNPRDLQWASLYARLAIEDKHKAGPWCVASSRPDAKPVVESEEAK